MDLLAHFNIVSVVAAGVSLWATYGIYRWSKAVSIIWLIIAFAYLLVFRSVLLVTQYVNPDGWFHLNASYFAPVMYVLIAVGMVKLYLSLLRTVEVPERRKSNESFEGPDRRTS